VSGGITLSVGHAGTGGHVTVTSGKSTAATSGGDIDITAGSSTMTSSGHIQLVTQAGAAPSGPAAGGMSGDIWMSTGLAGKGNSGAVVIGTGTATTGHGGMVEITVGSGNSGVGGAIHLQAGKTTDTNAPTGAGGSVTIQTGVSGSHTSGSMFLQTVDSPAGGTGMISMSTGALYNCSSSCSWSYLIRKYIHKYPNWRF
jgi:hypothetical protein